MRILVQLYFQVLVTSISQRLDDHFFVLSSRISAQLVLGLFPLEYFDRVIPLDKPRIGLMLLVKFSILLFLIYLHIVIISIIELSFAIEGQVR